MEERGNRRQQELISNDQAVYFLHRNNGLEITLLYMVYSIEYTIES